MAQIAERAALRLKLETYAVIPQCVCVCSDGGDGIAAPAGERLEFRVAWSLVGELNDSRDNEKD